MAWATKDLLAKDVALAVGDETGVARSVTGLSVIHRERGNLPAARSGLLEALELATAGGDSSTLVTVYGELVTLEKQSDDLPRALEYAWRAVGTRQERSERLRSVAVLGGMLADASEWSAAEDAWTVVAYLSREKYYLIYAWDALAYLAALRGDETAFELRAARCDALGWEESGQRAAAAEILHYRGLSYRALGRLDEADEWLARAIDFAELHGFNRTLFAAEEARKSLECREQIPAAEPAVATSAELRIGLREMKTEAIGAGASNSLFDPA